MHVLDMENNDLTSETTSCKFFIFSQVFEKKSKKFMLFFCRSVFERKKKIPSWNFKLPNSKVEVGSLKFHVGSWKFKIPSWKLEF
jgi:hypothetical protein